MTVDMNEVRLLNAMVASVQSGRALTPSEIESATEPIALCLPRIVWSQIARIFAIRVDPIPDEHFSALALESLQRFADLLNHIGDIK